jgi:hypothetical protein
MIAAFAASPSYRGISAAPRDFWIGHVWTTPALQEEFASHVSGLFARHHDRWP